MGVRRSTNPLSPLTTPLIYPESAAAAAAATMDFGYELEPWAFGVHCACAGVALACLPFAVYYGALIKHRLLLMTVRAPPFLSFSLSVSCRASLLVGSGATRPNPHTNRLATHNTMQRSPCSASPSPTKTCSSSCPRDMPPGGPNASGGS